MELRWKKGYSPTVWSWIFIDTLVKERENWNNKRNFERNAKRSLIWYWFTSHTWLASTLCKAAVTASCSRVSNGYSRMQRVRSDRLSGLSVLLAIQQEQISPNLTVPWSTNHVLDRGSRLFYCDGVNNYHDRKRQVLHAIENLPENKAWSSPPKRIWIHFAKLLFCISIFWS